MKSDWLNEEMPRQLPGGPRRKLVRAVKDVIFKRLRSRPYFYDECWQEAWKWASSHKWPSPEQIAARFIGLALMEMHKHKELKLKGVFTSLPMGEKLQIGWDNDARS